MPKVRIRNLADEDALDELLDNVPAPVRSRPVVRCRKRRFTSEGDALEVIAHARRRLMTESNPYIPIRYYWCGLCEGYHLTSKELLQREAQIIDLNVVRQNANHDDQEPDPPTPAGLDTPALLAQVVDFAAA